MLSEREDIAITELAVYILFIAFAIAVVIKHGFFKGRAWIYLIVFCGLRIASATLETLSANNPTSRDDATWAAILGSIGLSPLLLVASGLLRRVYVCMSRCVAVELILCDSNDSIAGAFRGRLLELLHIPILLALILAIVGGTQISSSDSSKHSSGESFEKGAGIIFLISYLILVALALLTATELGNVPRGEKYILFAVLASLPLLAVRLLYSLLADFEDNSTFNIVDGNVTVQLCMAIIEEFIVTFFFLIAGFVAPALGSLMNGAGGVPMNRYHGQKDVA